MEILAMTTRERAVARCSDSPPLSQAVIDNYVKGQLGLWMRNADKVEQALEYITDVRRWPKFAVLLSLAMTMSDAAERLAAIDAIREMLCSALADEALDEVKHEMGVE